MNLGSKGLIGVSVICNNNLLFVCSCEFPEFARAPQASSNADLRCGAPPPPPHHHPLRPPGALHAPNPPHGTHRPKARQPESVQRLVPSE